MDIETEYEKPSQDLSECRRKKWRLEVKIIEYQAISEILFIILLAETLYLILK